MRYGTEWIWMSWCCWKPDIQILEWGRQGRAPWGWSGTVFKTSMCTCVHPHTCVCAHHYVGVHVCISVRYPLKGPRSKETPGARSTSSVHILTSNTITWKKKTRASRRTGPFHRWPKGGTEWAWNIPQYYHKGRNCSTDDEACMSRDLRTRWRGFSLARHLSIKIIKRQ